MADPIELDAEPEPDEEPEPEPTPKPSAARYAGVGTPEKPLPRLWKVKEEDEPGHEVSDVKKVKNAKKAKAAAESGPIGKSSKKGATDKKAKDKDGGEKGVLIEETPVYDTVEARQRLRILIGSGLTGLVLVIGFVIYRQFQPDQPPDEPSPQDVVASATTPPPVNLRDQSEKEGRLLYNRAHEVAKNGKTDLALDLLKKVAKSYPNTQAAIESKQALDRPRQNLPLFLDRPAVVASPNDVPPPAAREGGPDEGSGRFQDDRHKRRGRGGEHRAAGQPPRGPSRPDARDARASGGNRRASASPGLPPACGNGGTRLGLAAGDRRRSRRRADGPRARRHVFPGARRRRRLRGPRAPVNLGTYYIDQHEVTVRQFNLYQKEAGKRTERCAPSPPRMPPRRTSTPRRTGPS